MSYTPAVRAPRDYSRTPIEFAVADKYHMTLDAYGNGGDLAMLAINSDPVLGHEGIKALDHYYASEGGKKTVPLLVQDNLSSNTFYSPVAPGAPNCMTSAVVQYESAESTTLLAFWESELPNGELIKTMMAEQGLQERQAQLLYVAERISHFLSLRTPAEVQISLVDSEQL